MKLLTTKRVPLLLSLSVLLPLLAVTWARLDFFDRFERITYDLRVRAALAFPAPTATNLAFAYIDENTIRAVRNRTLGYSYGLYWPRQVYGRLVDELTEQGAEGIAFDVMFGERRPDHPPMVLSDQTLIESDDYFAQTLRRAGNVILAASQDLLPPALFLTNTFAVGDISTDKDTDGILRRVKVFRSFTQWHSAFRQLEADPSFGVDLRDARIETNRVILPRGELDPIEIPLDNEGCFDLADFGGDNLPPGVPRKAKPVTQERRWHMGLLLAGIALGIDFERAQVDLNHGYVKLPLKAGGERVLPVDPQGYLYIDWRMPPNHPALRQQPVHELLAQNRRRWEGSPDVTNSWRDLLVVIGSSALANDLTDRGATPLSKDRDTLLVSKHWNVANSVITGRFVRRSPPWADMALVAVLGLVTARFCWRNRPPVALLILAATLAGFTFCAFALYIFARLWIPIIVPLLAAFLVTLAILGYRVVFEESERRRIKAVFTKMVSPKIVAELLAAPRLALGGARREITVFFADVRGFTEYTDTSQEQVLAYIRDKHLSGAAAEACFEDHARETLQTVNLYLSTIANVIIGNDGTHDKFIGDCVMAFWGAPTDNPRHAVSAVRAAVAAQRAIFELNRQRLAQNERRSKENEERIAKGMPLSPLLPVLSLGTGINTGMAVAGLMGSKESDSLSYTVFGREVNLASRLEGASGSGRIFISEGTLARLQQDDPVLAATCIAHEPIKVKGFRAPVKIFEVPWKTAEMEFLNTGTEPRLRTPAPEISATPITTRSPGETLRSPPPVAPGI